jgi:UDP-glucuronate 4-epimerase
MALFLFTKSILENKPISVFNHGNMIRDFTYVGDIVESIKKLLSKPPTINKNWDTDKPNPKSSNAPFSIYNIGNSNPVPLIEYIKQLEIALGKKATYNFLDIQPGDVPATHADIQDLEKYIKFRPQISVKEGIQNFVNWYLIWKNK